MEGRHGAVCGGAQAGEEALARMHRHPPHATRLHGVDELAQFRVAVPFVRANAALDRHFGAAHLGEREGGSQGRRPQASGE